MSHELRTPLNAILGFSSLMIDGVTGPVSDQQRGHLMRIKTGGQHLLTLINEILSLTRLEAQREEVHVEKGDAFVVSDTGIGIEPQHRERIFEPFYQIEMTKARRVAGTGLGLTVTRHLARLLGGDVEVAEPVDGVSTFRVRLPRDIAQREGATAELAIGERLVMSRAGTRASAGASRS